MEVQVYTKTDCPFRIQAKQWFKEFNIDIISSVLTGTNIKIPVEARVRDELAPFIPANTGINKINWIS